MAEIVQEGAAGAVRSRRMQASREDPAEAALHRRLADRALVRTSSATWSSTLCAADLACLMSVIESQLLPRLLREFRPDGRAHLKTRRMA